MKEGKAIVVLGAISLLLGILACGSGDETVADSTLAAQEVTIPPPTKTRTPTNTPQSPTEIPPSETPMPSTTPSPTNIIEPIPTAPSEKYFSVKIIPSSINVRSGPGPDNDVIGYLYQDDEAKVIDTNPDQTWYQVQLDDGSSGWIGSSLVDLIETAFEGQDSEEQIVSEEIEPAEVFSDKRIFPGVGTEIISDPDDILSGFLSVDVEDIVSNELLYRYYFTEGSIPGDLYEDICPIPYQTVWCAFEADGDGPISIGFTVEVQPESDDRADWFSPIFMDEFDDLAGNPTFKPPVYLTMCTDPANKHSHTTFLESETLDLNRQTHCSIVVIEDGNQVVQDNFAEFSGPITATCFFDH